VNLRGSTCTPRGARHAVGDAPAAARALGSQRSGISKMLRLRLREGPTLREVLREIVECGHGGRILRRCGIGVTRKSSRSANWYRVPAPGMCVAAQAIEEELQRLGPPAEPAIDRARALLGDFQSFWDLETEAAERRKLLLSLFE
jgi:hypothetical protein